MQTDHEELARKIESEQPSRELDCEIAQSIGYTLRLPNENELPCRFADHRRWYDGEGLPVGWMEGASEFPANYTTSVDAALSLVTEGWLYDLYNENGYPEVILTNNEIARVAVSVNAATLAQAITAAALRALALKEAK